MKFLKVVGGILIVIQATAQSTAECLTNVVRMMIFSFNFQNVDSDGNAPKRSKTKPKADGLIIHIHGGGFVAQSSKSHEVLSIQYQVSS